MSILLKKIEEIPKVGKIRAKKLNKIGINTVQDLIFYFPFKYNDFSKIIPIYQALQKLNETVCVKGEIIEIENIRTPRKRIIITEALIKDESSQIRSIWFNQPFLKKSLKIGDWLCLAGRVDLYKNGLYLNNPAFEKITKNQKNIHFTHTGRLVPVYSETKGITSRWLRSIIKQLLYKVINQVPEVLPIEVIKKFKLFPIKKALWQIHFPDSLENAKLAKERFTFEEIFLLQLNILREKMKLKEKKSPICPMNIKLLKEFTSSLPFTLTNAQKKCAFQILKDLEKPFPMSRLLEGDVGSGKTVVAAMAMLNTVKCGYQVALMTPTEILSKQHFKSLTELLKNFSIKIGLLTSKEAKIFKENEVLNVSKKSLLGDIENGQIDIVIGTHSLIQKDINFKNLALVVVDEQHRFGVEQRAKLVQGKETIPHLLSMTATPIPRTLALTIYGDLELSIIDEMPKNRKKVKTIIVTPEKRQKAYEFIRKEVKEGKGVFVICPKIESKNLKNQEFSLSEFSLENISSENIKQYDLRTLKMLEVKAVKDEYEKLSKEIFPDLKIGMLHGKMKPKEKEKIMTDFKNGEIDILVSTSVIEVGIDIPRATIIMIEGAERFGLAQLHQFRGRVGRSDVQSYCLLFTTSPNQIHKARLKALVECDNGFELAQKDLEIRGPGSLLGTQQWGFPDVAMEGLTNITLVEKCQIAAKEILEKDKELKNYPLLREKLKSLEKRIHFE